MARVPSSSMASTITAYWMPLLLFFGSMFYQLYVIPRSFPTSHYDVLGVQRHSSMEEVEDAYQKLSSKWNLDGEVPITADFIKIRYGYELLTNRLWKRDYDIFGIDEHSHVIKKLIEKYDGRSFSAVELPLLDAAASDPGHHAFSVITSKDFQYELQNTTKPWLVQVYSKGSIRCAQFFNEWKRTAELLDGIANVGMVELADVQLAVYLSERSPTGRPIFKNGLPSIVAFPPGCKMTDCLIRYEGELSADAVTDWFATTILSLPRILYYSKETLGQKFLARSGSHKVKVIFFSTTGERATPFMRHVAKLYEAYASYALVLWRQEETSVWWNAFEVESAPAIVFLKDPGVKPVVYHGPVNNSLFVNIMEQNKQQELPQLRSATSMELGCDARGYSRAGNDTLTWYCVILAGRQSPELDEMRATMRRVQQSLLENSDGNGSDKDRHMVSSSAITLKNKRLSFTWLDGEAQNKYCLFYLQSETSYLTCGPRRDIGDVPQLFIVRYKRNVTEDTVKVEEKPKSILSLLQDQDVDPAAQLVARYNGSSEVPEIIQWISKTITDGDSNNLPFYRTKTPELVPEDGDTLSRGARNVLSGGMGMKQRIQRFISRNYDRLGDPRIGPALLLSALLSFGAIWLQRSQQTLPSQSNKPIQPGSKDEATLKRRARARNASKKDLPPSMTDVEPKDAYEVQWSDSDSE